jgi:hypothetical protein
MRVTEIETGRAYVVSVVIPAGPRTPRFKTRRRATVTDIAGAQAVTVEVPEPVCVNADDFAPEQIPWAMVNGHLRYEQRPTPRVVRAADILEPAPEARQ